MSRVVDRKVKIDLFQLAAIAIATAGVLHLVRAPLKPPGFPPELFSYAEVLFIVGGILQIFWVLPMIKQWGKPWYCAGIIGTLVFMSLWFISRVPNPLTGVALPNNVLGYATETLQVVYIITTAIIIAKEKTILQTANEKRKVVSDMLTSLSKQVRNLTEEIDILKQKL